MLNPIEFLKSTYAMSTRGEAFGLIAVAVVTVIDLLRFNLVDVALDLALLGFLIKYIREDF